jgi:hypothetical protein
MAGPALRLIVSDSDSSARERLAARACTLGLLAVAYVSFEATVAALVGMAWGSAFIAVAAIAGFIAGLPGLVIAWRFSWPRIASGWAEVWARRLVAAELVLIAAYAVLEPARTLVAGRHMDLGRAGVILAVSGVVVMPVIGWVKQRLAGDLGSSALLGDGRQNLVCGALAMGVLVGLASKALFDTRWPESVLLVGIAAYAVWAAREVWRGGAARPSVASGWSSRD